MGPEAGAAFRCAVCFRLSSVAMCLRYGADVVAFDKAKKISTFVVLGVDLGSHEALPIPVETLVVSRVGAGR